MRTVPRRLLLLAVLIVVIAACTPPTTPAAPPAVPTEPPTATPVPATATPAPTAAPTATPTATPDLRPSLTNLAFANNPQMTDKQSYGAKFPFGVSAIYAAFDFANLPARPWLKWTLTRDDYGVLDTSEYLTATTGTALHMLIDQPRLLLPGKYHLTATVGKLSAVGEFVIDMADTKPGTTLVMERFDNNDLAWGVYDEGKSAVGIDQGRLQISVNSVDYHSTSLLPVALGDLDVSATAQKVKGPYNGYYGILFRFLDGRGYVFEVEDDGYFNVGNWTPADYIPLIDWTPSSAIKSGAVNSLRVVARGNQFAFYINDQQVATLSDSTYQRGSFGFVAGNFAQAGVKVNFDDVLVTVPQESALLVVATKVATAVPQAAVTPKAAATKAVAVPPLKTALIAARNAVEAIGGAMDRIYHGGGAEACGPFMSSYMTVLKSPTYDVSAQPANVQGAYARYRQGVEYLAGSKVSQIAKICLQGGGTIGNLDFNEARQAVNTAGGMLTEALATLGQ